jgi:hypothetical protein
VIAASEARARRLLGHCIKDLELDLSGLRVFTEAASGPYLHTPILAALAGATQVYAVAADSPFADKEEVAAATAQAARAHGVADRIDVLFERSPAHVGESDIVTNSGFVRPIDRELVAAMKPTAVIPLMWETWEFRDADLDLAACHEHGILVLGTDESAGSLDLYGYSGFLALKLLFELGLEGHKTRAVLLGTGPTLARPIWRHLGAVGISVEWFSDGEPESRPYAELRSFVAEHGAGVDAYVVAEHVAPVRLLGRDGLVEYAEIRSANPAAALGIISGDVDREAIGSSGLRYAPARLRPFGYMSYAPWDLGPRPVLELYAAGLKVGEAMARARLRGLDADAAVDYALAHSPAMRFDERRSA